MRLTVFAKMMTTNDIMYAVFMLQLVQMHGREYLEYCERVSRLDDTRIEAKCWRGWRLLEDEDFLLSKELMNNIHVIAHREYLMVDFGLIESIRARILQDRLAPVLPKPIGSD